MKIQDYGNWLIEHGGPIVRYLTIRESVSSLEVSDDMGSGLMRSEVVRCWMDRLTGSTGFSDIHGSRDTCFENVLGKLSLFGMRKGIGEFDRRCRPYMSLLENDRKALNVLEVFRRTIVASLLAVAGYLDSAVVRDLIMERLDTVFEFVRNVDYSIYVDKKKFKGIPRAFRNHPVIDPDLYVNGKFALPWIYDIFAFRALDFYTDDESTRHKIGVVISYVMHPDYQRLHEGYGLVLNGKNRYNVMGWDVWLPGYDGLHHDDFKMGCLVQRIELLSVFPGVVSSSWFIRNFDHLEGFVTEKGTYRFPGYYIKEKKNSYFMTGAHMGLGENRRQKSAIEIESSFWMYKTMRNVERTGRRK